MTFFILEELNENINNDKSMRLSTKGRYSTRLLIDIAVYGNGGFVLLKDAARRQQLSEKYLSHLAGLLKSAGLVRAQRGSHGGIALRRNISEITLKDIISAVEGPILIEEDVGSFEDYGVCCDQALWQRVQEGISKLLEAHTLEMIASEYKSRMEDINYVI